MSLATPNIAPPSIGNEHYPSADTAAPLGNIALLEPLEPTALAAFAAETLPSQTGNFPAFAEAVNQGLEAGFGSVAKK